MKSTRRTFIGNTLAIGGAMVVSPFTKNLFAGVPQHQRGITAEGTLLRSPSVHAGEAITVKWDKASIWEKMQTNVISMNGHVGPTFVVNKGDTLSAEFKNALEQPFSIHWHGFELPEAMDGHPKDMFNNTESKTYSFKVKQRAGTYFYHSHAHEKTEQHVYRGMYGLFIVHDKEEEALKLPSGKRDIALAIQDVVTKDVNAEQRELEYDPNFMDGMNGWLGNTILANGTPNAYTTVERAWHRIRLVNASGARVYKIAVSTKQPFYVIASDGGLLEKPVKQEFVWLSPGERYELLVDFSQVNVGDSVSIVSEEYPKPPAHMGVDPTYPQGLPFTILRCDVTADATDEFSIPDTLSTIARFKESEAKRTRTFKLAMNGSGHTINDKSFDDMMRADEEVPLNELEIWEFTNTEDDMQHPMHIHGAQFQILSRSSGDVPEIERGWKDVFTMAPKEVVRVLIKFEEYTGMYLVHCHNLAHEDHGMMINFMVMGEMDVQDGSNQPTMLQAQPSITQTTTRITFAPSTTPRMLTLTDMRGVTLHSTIIPAGATEHTLTVHSYPSGMYWVAVGTHAVKIIVE